MTSGPSSGRLAYRFGPLVAEALAIAGLIWMLHIWRGTGRDTPADWRYRDEAETDPRRRAATRRGIRRAAITDMRASGWLWHG